MALTFDDGPDPVATPRFVDELARLEWRATFFVLGEAARRAPDVVRSLVDAGHEVAVHGDVHVTMARRSPRAVSDDIARGYDTVADITGVAPRWFRPPFGTLTLSAMRAARRRGLTPVLWTNWGRHWRAQATPATVVADVLRRPLAGATVLLHDSDAQSAPGSWRTTIAALPLLARAIDGSPLRIGPLCEHWVANTTRRAPSA